LGFEHAGAVVAASLVASDVGAIPPEPGKTPAPPFGWRTYAGSAGPDVPCIFGGITGGAFAAFARAVILCKGGGGGFGGGVLMRGARLMEKTSGFRRKAL